MQMMAVSGIQPPTAVTHGDARQHPRLEDAMLEHDPRTADDPRERDEDPRDRDARERDRTDPRDVFLRELDLPRGPDRKRVFDGDREYTLRGSESRTLATVGAFRVGPRPRPPRPRRSAAGSTEHRAPPPPRTEPRRHGSDAWSEGRRGVPNRPRSESVGGTPTRARSRSTRARSA